MSDPVPVIPLEYAADPAGTPSRLRWWLRFLARAAWIACVLAWLAILVDVETVLASGPVILLLGAGLFVLAWRARSPRHMVIGAAHCAICLLFFVLVQRMHWGPQAARVPFAVMGAAYAAAAAVATTFQPSRARPGARV